MNILFVRGTNLLAGLLIAVLLSACGAEQNADLVMCEDTIDSTSPILNNGFGFNLNNTRNQESPITSDNVHSQC